MSFDKTDTASPYPGGASPRARALVFSVLALLVFTVLVAMLHRQQAVDSPGIAARHLTNLVRTGGAGFSWGLGVALAVAGVAIGLLGGTLGMGGGVLKVAGLLLLFRYDIHFARAVSIVTMFILAAAAVLPELRRRRARVPVSMMVGAGVAVLVGVIAGNALSGAVLTHVFGFFVLFLGLHLLGQVLADPRQLEAKAARRRRAAAVPPQVGGIIGALHGFVCGLLGISGGVVSMPLQQLSGRATVHQAIFNSLLVTVVAAGVGSLLIVPLGVAQGRLDLSLLVGVVLSIGVGAAAGARIAARLRGRIFANLLRGLAVALCTATGFSILI